ncbi:transmembrane amino acid transporter protein-domain-containing protein [Gilbertella persicaria]|uniref:transmembrane amino acid transporter protein-domain-containing protein n=1 Tax=Gilbertella persicaria TaxID=101096 RepID=UPI00222048E3|nr:transmembrane amino acid transporter protein-domain-containing protein [Gilbertella persicaria]KAI8087769.1 transmembrane amino acid transporter protein-domain-containing protein [Gilbertella persicaria]
MSDSINIPNLHPSQRVEEELSRSFKDQFESFVGSYSRASLMHMAENVIVSDNRMEDDDSVYSARHSEGALGEQTPLLLPSPSLCKVDSYSSVVTIGDDYKQSNSKKSSFLQSIFNSINILIGVGVLSLPMGFKSSGWLISIIIFCFCFGLTNYTAKLLAKCLDTDPESRTYGDMGAMVFGAKGRVFISCLFLAELITCSVALVVLLSDGIESLFPGHNPFLIRLVSFAILTPTLYIPIRHLSYTSLLGILSVISLLAVIIYDGLSKPTAPGSLHQMEPTATLLPVDYTAIPMSFGLIMAGFAGHAVFPTIYRDMKHPEHYTQMVNYSYFVAAMVYMAVAASGYAMFGSKTMQEITQNLVMIPEYNQTLNRLAVYLIAINPIAKYGLTLNPVVLSWQMGLLPHLEPQINKTKYTKTLVKWVGILLTSASIVTLAILIPDFDKVMSLLGASFSFLISGIFPIFCYLKLFKLPLWKRMLNYALVSIAILMAITGTIKSCF